MSPRRGLFGAPRLGLYAALLWPAVVFFFAAEALPKLRVPPDAGSPFLLMERLIGFVITLAAIVIVSLIAGKLAGRALAARPRAASATTTLSLALAVLAVGLAGATRPLGWGPTTFGAYLRSLPVVAELGAARADRASPGDDALACGHQDGAATPGGPPVVDRCCSWVSSDNPLEAATPPLKKCSVHVHLGTHGVRMFEGAEQRSWTAVEDEARGAILVSDGSRRGVALTRGGELLQPVYGYQFADAIAVHGSLYVLGLLGLGCATLLVLLRARDLRAHRRLSAGREAMLEADGRLSFAGASALAPSLAGVAPGPMIVLDGHVAPGAYRADAELKGRVVPDVRDALCARADRLAALAHVVLVVTASPLVARAVMGLVAPLLR